MVDSHAVLGFYAGEVSCDPGSAWVGDELRVDYWDRQHKDFYLFRSDIRRPLSADYAVWPSVFDLKQENPVHDGFIQNLWSDLGKLLEHLRGHEAELTKPFWVVGVTLCWDLCSSEERQMWSEIVGPTEPDGVQARWEFLGYDVADRWLTSGLSSCFNPNSRDFGKLKQQWGPHLNEFHLFDESSKAYEFRTLANKEIDDHVPFFVYGLWRIPLTDE